MFSALKPSIGPNRPQCIDRELSAVSSNFEGYLLFPGPGTDVRDFPTCNLTSVETFPCAVAFDAVFAQAAPLI
jgi:hypothetical protein